MFRESGDRTCSSDYSEQTDFPGYRSFARTETILILKVNISVFAIYKVRPIQRSYRFTTDDIHIRSSGTIMPIFSSLSFCLSMRSFRLSLFTALIAVACLPIVSVSAQELPYEEVLRAEVIDSHNTPASAGSGDTSQAVRLRLLTGDHAGAEITVEQGLQKRWMMEKGDTVVVRKFTRADLSVEYMIAETYRLPAILWIAALFAGLSLLLGGWKGLGSLAGLVLSIGILIFFIVPKIAVGADPVMTSLIGALAIACSSLFMAHGFNKRTLIALISTLATLVIAAILASIFVRSAGLFGLGSEEALFLQYGSLEHINLRGLLLGGIIIGCLGVLDDVTTTQTAVVDELMKANRLLDRRELFRAGMSIGREHVASMINTLAMVYAGASMPLLLLFTMPSDYPLWFILNGEFLAEEIIRTLVGSTALLFAVPISTMLASLLLKHQTVLPRQH